MTPPTPPASPTRHKPGRRRARKGEGELLRDEILDAAEALLFEQGSMEAVTIREVAERVGVSAPAIYLHFADKETLFYETCRRNFEVLNARLVEAMQGEGTVVDRMMRAGRAYIGWGLEHPGQYLTLFGTDTMSEIPDDRLPDDPGVQAFQLLVAALHLGLAEGELRSDLDVDAAAVSVWAAVHGTVFILLTKRWMEKAHQGFPTDAAVVDATLEIVLNGIRS
jgi:AcrR family transcriptional regulator